MQSSGDSLKDARNGSLRNRVGRNEDELDEARREGVDRRLVGKLALGDVMDVGGGRHKVA